MRTASLTGCSQKPGQEDTVREGGATPGVLTAKQRRGDGCWTGPHPSGAVSAVT